MSHLTRFNPIRLSLCLLFWSLPFYGCSGSSQGSNDSLFNQNGEEGVLGFGSTSAGGGTLNTPGSPAQDEVGADGNEGDALQGEPEDSLLSQEEPDGDTPAEEEQDVEEPADPDNTEEGEGGGPVAYECDLGDEEECVTECGSIGIQTCGKTWGPCIPPAEICNGTDDDCNGLVDDGLDPPPSEEVCDGEDNDCDGLVDEDLFQPCPCDPLGQTPDICVDGVWSGCPDIESAVATIEIPYLEPNCPWNEGDNIAETQAALAARVEQEVPFTIPGGGNLCSFSISGATDDFYFDDHILLLFNDVPLIGSINFMNAFSLEDGLPVYDWNQLVGKNFSEFEGTTCLPGHIQCAMPGTQVNGEVSLSFDAPTNDMLATSGTDGLHVFRMVVIGDNDPSVDCHHNGLTMIIEYQYQAMP